MGKRNSIALKFLESAKEKEVAEEDIQITELTKSSLLYRSLSPKSYRQNPKDKEKKTIIKPIAVVSAINIKDNSQISQKLSSNNVEISNKLNAGSSQNIESLKEVENFRRKESKAKTQTISPFTNNLQLKVINSENYGAQSLNYLNTPRSAKGEVISQNRPVFKYIPQKEEVREMILKAVTEAMKR